MQVLDPATNMIVAQIPVGASPHHPLFAPMGEYALVVSQGPGVLEIIEPKNNTVANSVTVGKNPHWIARVEARAGRVDSRSGYPGSRNDERA